MAQPSRQFKDSIYEQFARVGRALASPRRLELLDLLCQGPRTVEELSRQASQSLANTSQHLQVLKEARLLESDKAGVYVTYRLAGPEVCELFQSLRGVAESRLADVERITREFLNAWGALEPVNQEDLSARVQRGEVTVLDVRPSEEYRAAHIPGAISAPLPELEQILTELPRSREVVAYCRGPYCVMAIQAVDVLRARGFTAHRMEDGVPDWRARGLPVDVS